MKTIKNMKTTKSEKFLNLYKEIINSTNYNKILDNIDSYSKLEIENIYEKLENKVSNLRDFFKTEKENLTKENLITIFNEIEKQELFFSTEDFFERFEILDIYYEINLNNIKKFKKNQLIELIELTIDSLIFDFENLIDYGTENNPKEINYLKMKKSKETEKFLKLYKKLINSTKYNKILYNIDSYSKLEIENIYEKLENKVSNLRDFFKTEKENLTKENLITILKEIDKEELFFYFYGRFETDSEILNLNNYKKTKLIEIIELTIDNLIIDFKNLIYHGNENNQIQI